MALRPAHNPSDQPVHIDDLGHTLGGGEWGAVDPAQPAVLAAVATGRLVVPDELGDDANDAARAAQAAAGGAKPAPKTSTQAKED